MKDKDQIQELFSKKLGNHEATVHPELWNGIASQVAATTSASAGISVLSKVIISVVSVAAISTAIVIYSSSEKEVKSEKITKNETKTIILEQKEPVLTEKQEKSIQIENASNEDLASNKKETQFSKEHKPSKPSLLPEKELENFTESKSETTGILKEREEDPIVEYKPSKESFDYTLKEVSKENKIEEQTTFSIDIDKEQLVEEYSITKMPDIFTPNNDGQNDFLFVESNGIIDFSIVIMNEKSNIIFQSIDLNFKWDGNDIYGNPVPTGKYIYFITGNDRSGNPVKKYQSLTLVR